MFLKLQKILAVVGDSPIISVVVAHLDWLLCRWTKLSQPNLTNWKWRRRVLLYVLKINMKFFDFILFTKYFTSSSYFYRQFRLFQPVIGPSSFRTSWRSPGRYIVPWNFNYSLSIHSHYMFVPLSSSIFHPLINWLDSARFSEFLASNSIYFCFAKYFS